jgi:hypothetical protein
MVSRSSIASTTRKAMASVVWPIASADPAAAIQVAVPTALVAHEFVDHPSRDAGILKPGRESVAQVVGAAQIDGSQQRIRRDRQRRPSARRGGLVVGGRHQAGRVQLA